jgi:hypothetical protein
MRRFSQVLLAGVVVAALSTAVQASVLYQHSGSNDPAGEGFVLDAGSHDAAGSAVNDGGVAAWNIAGTNGMYRYVNDLSSVAADMSTQGWYLEWKVRDKLTTDWASHCHAYMEVTNGSSKIYNVLVGPDSGDLYVYGANGGFGTYNELYSAAGQATDWHTYRLVVDAGATGTSPAHFYADGVYRTDITPLDFPYRTNALVWGNSGGSGDGAADVNWAQVTLGLGAPPSVPEPSTMTLVIAGVLGLLAYAWRTRK